MEMWFCTCILLCVCAGSFFPGVLGLYIRSVCLRCGIRPCQVCILPDSMLVCAVLNVNMWNKGLCAITGTDSMSTHVSKLQCLCVVHLLDCLHIMDQPKQQAQSCPWIVSVCTAVICDRSVWEATASAAWDLRAEYITWSQPLWAAGLSNLECQHS